MRSEDDIRGSKIARNEFSRRGFDISRADIRLARGVLHIQGVLGAAGMRPDEFKAALETAVKVLKSKPEIRDVVINAAYLS
jgi:hypothetical protein